MQDDEYRRLAEVEDAHWYFRNLHRLIEGELVTALGRRSASVLDAGCGTGGLMRRLAGRYPWHWTGADVARTACELARTRNPGVPVLEASLTALPFAAGRFDAVVCADVLYHIADDGAALRELRRVLRPDGQGLLVVNVPAHPWLWSYHDVAVSGLRRYSRSALRARLREAGFEPLRATHWNLVLLPLIAARRKLLPPPAGRSDVTAVSGPQQLLGKSATALERALLRAVNFPLGSSLLATAH